MADSVKDVKRKECTTETHRARGVGDNLHRWRTVVFAVVDAKYERLRVLRRCADDDPLGSSLVDVDPRRLHRCHLARGLDDVLCPGRRPVDFCRVACREEDDPSVAHEQGLSIVRNPDQVGVDESAVGGVVCDDMDELLERGSGVVDGDDCKGEGRSQTSLLKTREPERAHLDSPFWRETLGTQCDL